MKHHSSSTYRSPLELLKIWISASRPRTLTASFVPILAGTVISQHQLSQIDWVIGIITLLSAVLVQVGINLANDALDFKQGVDNTLRVGFKRATQSGLLTYHQVLFGSLLCFCFALLLGIPLIVKGGIPVLIVLLVSIILGYSYTGGPYPLKYYGLGEIFSFLFYGLVITITPFYLQTRAINGEVLLLGTQIGFLSVAIIATNNLRDIESDRVANKKTFPVLFGITFGRIVITTATIIPLILGFFWIFFDHTLAAILPLLTLSSTYTNLRSIWNTEPSVAYNAYFIKIAQNHLFFGLFFTLGYIIK